MSQKPINFFNRGTGAIETELVYGEEMVRLAYQNPAAKLVTDHLITTSAFGKLLSQAYGSAQSSRMSIKKIAPFIERYKIKMSDFEDRPFQSFNDFFIRKFKAGQRPFAAEAHRMPAPAEARYLGWSSITPDLQFPVKGKFLSSRALLGDSPYATQLEGGPLFIARLCPVDYHRFHYMDDGSVADFFEIHGKYHSVNPVAVQAAPEVFATNERHVSILKTKNFGTLAYVEVGALMVGKIVQSHPSGVKAGSTFNRGDEKGYFLFGGSTVIVMGQKGAWKPSQDIITNTEQKIETYLKLGEECAVLL